MKTCWHPVIENAHAAEALRQFKIALDVRISYLDQHHEFAVTKLDEAKFIKKLLCQCEDMAKEEL